MISNDIWHKYHEWYFEILYVRLVKFETILKYHEQIMLLFVYTTTRKKVCLHKSISD